MPMGGLGERFQNSEYALPKPLIEVDGKPMFLRALDSVLPIKSGVELYLIIRSDLDALHNLKSLILAAYPTAQVIVLKSDTRGASETVLEARSFLDLSAPLLILDCDLFFHSEELFQIYNSESYMNFDGALLYFQSGDKRYSYVVEANGFANRVAEKDVISNNALIGAYFWSKAVDFVRFADECLLRLQGKQTECYISSVVDFAIQNGLKFRVFPGSFFSFGTPEELKRYQHPRNS